VAGKFWGLLFLLVPALGTLIFWISWAGDVPSSDALVTMPWYRHWLPEDVSSFGHKVDSLFYFILILTGLVFVVTEVALAMFIWQYDARRNTRPAVFTHGSHNLEVIWTILPAATLIFIALHQMDAWAEAKLKVGQPVDPFVVEVTGRQFEWRIKYPGPDGQLETPDDVTTVNSLHLPVGANILVKLKSQDVLHSFFLPNLRVKQDAVPGMVQNVWFQPVKTGQYDIVCAELCGWGHYKMRGELVIQSPDDFQKWMDQAAETENITRSMQQKAEE